MSIRVRSGASAAQALSRIPRVLGVGPNSARRYRVPGRPGGRLHRDPAGRDPGPRPRRARPAGNGPGFVGQLLVLLALVWVVPSYLIARYAKRRGDWFGGFLLLGLVIGPILQRHRRPASRGQVTAGRRLTKAPAWSQCQPPARATSLGPVPATLDRAVLHCDSRPVARPWRGTPKTVPKGESDENADVARAPYSGCACC